MLLISEELGSNYTGHISTSDLTESLTASLTETLNNLNTNRIHYLLN